MTLSGATAAHATDLQITITDVRSAFGTVDVCLFQSDKGFPDCTGNPTVLHAKAPAVRGTVRLTFANVAPGTYAATTFHDEKGLGAPEFGFLGIPRSGMGASNDARGRFGPPSFASAAFVVPDSRAAAIQFRMEYP